MIFFDSHFHYDAEESCEAVLLRMHDAFAAAGGRAEDELRVAVMGGGWRESLAARRFASRIPHGIFAAGIHPQGAAEKQASLQDFRTLLSDPACRAAGELGLDYFYSGETREIQRKVLETFLGLALELDLPAVLHCRDLDGRFLAYEDMADMVSAFAGAGGRAVVHCFTGSPAWAEAFLALGCMIGVTGMVTFAKASNVREIASMIPDDRILAETDSPYLAPVPFRGTANTAGNLPVIIRKLAQVRNCTPEKMAALTSANAARFYRVDSE